MIPSIEQKLIINTSFKQLVLSAMSRLIKIELDRLTVNNEPTNLAEQKLLVYLRNIMRNGGIQDAINNTTAKAIHTIAVLSMFDDSENDTISYELDTQGAIVVNWDSSKSIIMDKIAQNNYLYGLAGCEKSDHTNLIQ